MKNLLFLGQNHLKNLCIVGLIMLYLSSCLKDPLGNIDGVNGLRWKGNYAAPLINAELNLEDAVALVNNDWMNSLPDKTLVVHYDNKHISKKAEEIYNINDRIFNGNIVPTAAELNTLNNTGFVSLARNFVFDMAPGAGLQWDSLWLKSGTFRTEIDGNTGHPGKVTVEIADLRSNNTAVLIKDQWNAGGYIYRNPYHTISGIESLDLSKGNLGYNQIRVKVTWEMTKSGVVGNNEQLQLKLFTDGLKFRKLYGNLGQPNLLDVQDSLDLSLFSNKILKGNIVFQDARIKVHFSNGTGLKSQYQIQNLAVIMGDGSTVPVTSYSNNGTITSAPSGTAETRVADSVYITQATGSNVANLMKSEPHYLAYDVKVATALGRGFVWDNSTMDLKVSVELPLYVNTKDLVLEDTSDLDLGLGDDGKYIDMITFKIQSENSMPLGAAVQCYFMDASNQVLDSLFQPFRYLIKQAEVDAGGAVIASTLEKWELVIDKPRLTNILKATQLRTRAWIPTSTYNANPVPVRITTDQKLKLKMGLSVKMSADAKL